MGSLDESAVAEAAEEALAQAPDDGAAETRRDFLDELAAALEPAEEPDTRMAEALGMRWHAVGASASDVVREATRLAGALEGALARRGLGNGERVKLEAAAREACARAVAGHEAAQRHRRDRWLSFMVHDMRNALNTLVNAIWVLRQGDTTAAPDRILNVAERAVRKLEHTLNQVRDLEGFADTPAPKENEA